MSNKFVRYLALAIAATYFFGVPAQANDVGFRLELSNAGGTYPLGFGADDNVVVTVSNLSTAEDIVALRLHIGDTSKNFDGINCVINAGVCGQVNGQPAAGVADGVTFLINSDLSVFGGARDDEISVDFSSGFAPGSSFLFIADTDPDSFNGFGNWPLTLFNNGAMVDNASIEVSFSNGAIVNLSLEENPTAVAGVYTFEAFSTGACCTDGPGTASPCIITDQQQCEGGGGLYLGDGTACVSDNECTALLVTFDAMSATATPNGVLVRWTTATEIDAVGFRVLREADRREKKLEAISDLIPAAGNSLTGASYRFLDNSRQSLSAVHYYIEDIDVWGKVTRHGPILVDRGEREAGQGRSR